MEMSVVGWIIYHAIGTVFWLWLLRWGGAEWIEGWGAWGLLGWFSGHWGAEQIKLYALLILIGELIWFVLGLFFPACRFSL